MDSPTDRRRGISRSPCGIAQGAVLLTAHMGNYDLGAAIFAHRFRARDSHGARARGRQTNRSTSRCFTRAIAGGGAVQVAYNTAGMQLPLELLNALRDGQIVSIQGDRRWSLMSPIAKSAFLIGSLGCRKDHSCSRSSRRCRSFRSSLSAAPITGIASLPARRFVARAPAEIEKMLLKRECGSGRRRWKP